jgi:DNA polymerase III delta prime subunit
MNWPKWLGGKGRPRRASPVDSNPSAKTGFGAFGSIDLSLTEQTLVRTNEYREEIIARLGEDFKLVEIRSFFFRINGIELPVRLGYGLHVPIVSGTTSMRVGEKAFLEVSTWRGFKLVTVSDDLCAVGVSQLDALLKELLAIPIAPKTWDSDALDKVFWLPETEAIKRDLSFFTNNQEWFKRRNLPYCRAFLFYGPPGNGKTLTIRAIAKYLRTSAAAFDFSANYQAPDTVFRNWLLGEGAEDPMADKEFVTEALTTIIAHESTPKLISPAHQGLPRIHLKILEDIDHYFPHGGKVETSVTKSCLLNCLDGAVPLTHTIIIATANRPEALDQEILLRPGRFNRRVNYRNPLPQEGARFLRTLMLPEDEVTPEALHQVSESIRDLSFAYHFGIYESASAIAYEAGRPGLIDADLLKALDSEDTQIKLKAKRKIGIN